MSIFLGLYVVETINGQKFYYNNDYDGCNNSKEALCEYAKDVILKRRHRSFLRASSSLNTQETLDLLNNKYLFDKDKVEAVGRVVAKEYET